MLNIKKITDKIEELDVKGQGCLNDCQHYTANSSSQSSCGYWLDAYVNPWV